MGPTGPRAQQGPTNKSPRMGPTGPGAQQGPTNEWPQQGPGPTVPNESPRVGPGPGAQQGPTNEWAQWARALGPNESLRATEMGGEGEWGSIGLICSANNPMLLHCSYIKLYKEYWATNDRLTRISFVGPIHLLGPVGPRALLGPFICWALVGPFK